MKRDNYKNDVQIDYFSKSYLEFEQDFYKYSALDTPLTFLIDDILLSMAMSQKPFFKLNKENSFDRRDHYFSFKVGLARDNKLVRLLTYIGHTFVIKETK